VGSAEETAAQAYGPTPLDLKKTDLSRRGRRDALILGIPSAFLILVTMVLFAVRASVLDYKEPPYSWWWLAVAGIPCVVLLIALGVRSSDRRAEFTQARIRQLLDEQAVASEQSESPDSLYQLNRSLLGRYHDLSTNQARSSFRLAQYVMAGAALLLLAGGVAAISAESTAAGATIAALSAISSALGGYISSTLLKSYQISVHQAQAYFKEPFAGGYLMAAERLAKTLETSEQQQALGRVVDGFIQAAVDVSRPDLGQLPKETQPDPAQLTIPPQ
jgi:membrane protein implicated in regulation of membrane protease activity